MPVDSSARSAANGSSTEPTCTGIGSSASSPETSCSVQCATATRLTAPIAWRCTLLNTISRTFLNNVCSVIYVLVFPWEIQMFGNMLSGLAFFEVVVLNQRFLAHPLRIDSSLRFLSNFGENLFWRNARKGSAILSQICTQKLQLKYIFFC